MMIGMARAALFACITCCVITSRVQGTEEPTELVLSKGLRALETATVS